MSKVWSAVLVADLHLRSIDPYGVVPDGGGIDSRTMKRLSLLDDAIRFAIINKVGAFFILGDLFENRTISEQVRVQVTARLKTLDEIPVYYILGNHEIFMGHGLLESESGFSNNFHVISSPEYYYVFDGHPPILLLPDLGRRGVAQALEQWGQNQLLGLFGHTQVIGQHDNGEHVSKRGVALDAFRGIPLVLLGDFHKRQLFPGAVSKGNTANDFLWGYVGSLARNSFAEENQQKGFCCLKLQECGTGVDFTASIHAVNDTKFVTIDVSDGTTFEHFKSNAPSIDGAIVRMRFMGHEKWYRRLPISEMIDFCYNSGAVVVKKTELLIRESTKVDMNDAKIPKLNARDLVHEFSDHSIKGNHDFGLTYINSALFKVGDMQ